MFATFIDAICVPARKRLTICRKSVPKVSVCITFLSERALVSTFFYIFVGIKNQKTQEQKN